MKNLMIDLETLGKKADAVILSLSAVAFDMKTGKTGQAFHVTFDIDDCVRHGLKVDSESIRWWINQNKTDIKISFEEDKSLHRGMRDFCSWYFLNFGSSNPMVWGDRLSKIEYSMNIVNLELPWYRCNERSYVTVVNVLNKKHDIPFKGTPFYGVDNAKHKIKILTN